MKMINVVNGPQNASAIILGCMRMPALSVEQAAAMIRTAAEEGVNFFDHATCYGGGEAETRFGDAFPLTGLKREDVYIQSKCGLYFDRKEFSWSKADILDSADGILRRLKTDYLDALLLHRPDLLFDPEEVAEAFDELHRAGKVRHFGVSNVTPGQLELLKKYVKQPLVFNQLQFSLEQSQLIDNGLYLNNLTTERSVVRDNGVLDYCRLHDITVQAWSPGRARRKIRRIENRRGHRLDPAPSGEDAGHRRYHEPGPPAGHLRRRRRHPDPSGMVPALSRLRQIPAVKVIISEGPGVRRARRKSLWLFLSRERAVAPGIRKAPVASSEAKSCDYELQI